MMRMKLKTLNARACLPLLMGECRGEGAQRKQAIARNVAEILET
jgi:hypothetical protein